MLAVERWKRKSPKNVKKLIKHSHITHVSCHKKTKKLCWCSNFYCQSARQTRLTPHTTHTHRLSAQATSNAQLRTGNAQTCPHTHMSDMLHAIGGRIKLHAARIRLPKGRIRLCAGHTRLRQLIRELYGSPPRSGMCHHDVAITALCSTCAAPAGGDRKPSAGTTQGSAQHVYGALVEAQAREARPRRTVTFGCTTQRARQARIAPHLRTRAGDPRGERGG